MKRTVFMFFALVLLTSSIAYGTAVQTWPVQDAQAPTVKNLPLEEIRARGADSNKLAVLITGDGGWGVTDRGLGATLANHGIPVVGLNSLHYFWKARTPDGSAHDLEQILRHYLAAWKKEKVILIGYSFGADVLPFMTTRLPKDLLDRVQLMVLLGPSSTASFEFHVMDWFGASRKTMYPVRPEIEKLRGMKLLCFYGDDDDGAICKALDPHRVKIIALSGGHRIRENYGPVAEMILNEVRQP